MATTRSRLPRARGGRLTNLNPVFQRQTVQIESSQLTPFMVKQARKSGKLNLSCKNLTTGQCLPYLEHDEVCLLRNYVILFRSFKLLFNS